MPNAKQALSPSRDSAASSKLHPFMHKIKKESSTALFKHAKAILKFLLPKHQALKARLYLATHLGLQILLFIQS